MAAARARFTVQQITERQAIELLRVALSRPGADRAQSRRRGRVLLGIGDDAALVRAVQHPLVCSVDVSVQDVHFDLGWLSPEDLGWRSFNAAASDLAAMGATPLVALSSLIIPPDFAVSSLRQLGGGQAQASAALGCPVVGGNISRGAQLSVTTTVLGEAPRPLLRSQVRPGDQLWLVGEVGLAAAGLGLLQAGSAGGGRGLGRSDQHCCVQAWRRPQALLREGRKLSRHATAAIDLSDGLASDARRLAEAGRVRVVIEQDRLRRVLRRPLLRVADRLGRDALALALFGGEDYALLATGPPRRRPGIARRVGYVERGRGVVLQRSDGSQAAELEEGFDHFATAAVPAALPANHRSRRGRGGRRR